MKELWFDAFVERAEELEAEGLSEEEAHEQAANEAHDIMVDRLADETGARQ